MSEVSCAPGRESEQRGQSGLQGRTAVAAGSTHGAPAWAAPTVEVEFEVERAQSTTVCDCSRMYSGMYQNEPIALPVLPLAFQPPNGW